MKIEGIQALSVLDGFSKQVLLLEICGHTLLNLVRGCQHIGETLCICKYKFSRETTKTGFTLALNLLVFYELELWQGKPKGYFEK